MSSSVKICYLEILYTKLPTQEKIILILLLKTGYMYLYMILAEWG